MVRQNHTTENVYVYTDIYEFCSFHKFDFNCDCCQALFLVIFGKEELNGLLKHASSAYTQTKYHG